MAKSQLLDTPASIPDPVHAPPEVLFPPIELLSDDGEPMESDWHVKSMTLLTSCVDQCFADRDDYYVGGNMFIYFSIEQARNRDFRGPDFYLVWNTTRKPMRPYWVVWEEGGRTPDIIIELCSESTINEDYGRKKKVYAEVLRVPDYFCYDPATHKVDGWRLEGRKYVPLKPNPQGRLWSQELGLWIGPWKGTVGRFEETWPRFFDAEGRLVLSENEAAKAHAEEQTRLAEERGRLAAEQAARAEAAEARVAELEARLAGTNGGSDRPNGKRKK